MKVCLMEVVIFRKYGVKIFALFVVITLPRATIAGNEIIQFYANDDNGYEQDYGPLVGEDDDENDFSVPKSAEAVSDAESKPRKPGEKFVCNDTEFQIFIPFFVVPVTREAMNCDENQLMTYLAKLQVTNPESLLLIASYKDLEHLCRFVGIQYCLRYSSTFII